MVEEDVLNLFVALITVIKSKSNFSIFIVDSRQISVITGNT
jgi:hypothetical protein